FPCHSLYEHQFEHYDNKVDKLESDLKTAHEMIRELRKELEFYAQPDKWQCNGSTYVDNDDKTDTIEIPKHSEILREDTEEIGPPETWRRMWCAGKRARAVLQKWQGKFNE